MSSENNNQNPKPECQYFNRCGGCSAQHIPYLLQLDNKRERVRNAILNSGIISHDEDLDIREFSDKPYAYRNRMDFVFHRGGLGFRKKAKWREIIDIEHCPISNTEVNTLLKEVGDWFRANRAELDTFDPIKKQGTLRYAVIRAPEHTEDSSISFVLNADSSKITEHVEAIKGFAAGSTAKSILVTYVKSDTDTSVSSDYFMITGKEHLTEQLNNLSFSYSIQGFLQNNTVMAEKLITYCKELFAEHDTNDAFLLDLYGGVGSFGISMADIFSKVLIVESWQQSIDSAEQNITANSINNAEAVCHDATNLKRLDIEKQAAGKPLYILTDPPRSGMHPKTVRHLLDLEPETIIYVSCNPIQLSKELRVLKKQYALKSAAIFDLFPQTPHVETVVEIEKK
ncbi:23S rRNA (uracil(1939)-C(5))-methyltransferase RlmD [Candidatus Woesearchaeota archaeon]|nr:23S rRNA (uracil(1939)-C(5))-methyltransferase RlmD [Candidatus Woesearchaeota archaeon]